LVAQRSAAPAADKSPLAAVDAAAEPNPGTSTNLLRCPDPRRVASAPAPCEGQAPYVQTRYRACPIGAILALGDPAADLVLDWDSAPFLWKYRARRNSHCV